MVGSSFILIKCNGRRTLLNVAQVASIYTSDIEIASKAGQIEYRHRYSIEQGTIYTIQMMLTTRREMEYIFARAAERDEAYDQIVAALAPAVVIESTAPIVPEVPEQSWSRFRKPTFPNKAFATEAEYDRAVASVLADLLSGKNDMYEPPSTPEPPTPKPPRKPYTRKPRE
jgi:hypothetical protein